MRIRRLHALLLVVPLILARPLPGSADLLIELGVQATPPAFSPNGDGAKDVTDIAVSLNVPATLTLEVLDGADTPVRVLASDIPAPAGTSVFTWNGRDDASQVVTDGDYRVRAAADDGSGEVLAEAVVTVDTRAPKLRWRGIAPEPVTSNRAVHFRFRVSDRAETVSVGLSVTDDEGDVGDAEREVRPGDRTIDWTPRYRSGAPLLPGLYAARLTANDGAGNRARSAWKPFRDHRPVRSRVIHRLGGTGGRVALTFDDCNDSGAWGRILRILADRNAQASFFCLGPHVTQHRALARRTVAGGHTVGSHSMNHALETRLTYSQIVRQNRGPQTAWWKAARVTPAPFFRPPYGGYDAEVLRAVGDIGYARTVIWDVDPRDWERPGAAAIADRVVSHAHAGSIVVLHTLDGTAAALPSIITRLRAKGLEPVSLAELFHATGMREPADAGPTLADPFE